jgi:hypothetical protein
MMVWRGNEVEKREKGLRNVRILGVLPLQASLSIFLGLEKV